MQQLAQVSRVNLLLTTGTATGERLSANSCPIRMGTVTFRVRVKPMNQARGVSPFLAMRASLAW